MSTNNKMQDTSFIRLTVQAHHVIDIILSEDPEWEGHICDDCGGNVFEFKWLCEVYTVSRPDKRDYAVIESMVCVECVDFADTMQKFSRELLEQYANFTGFSPN